MLRRLWCRLSGGHQWREMHRRSIWLHPTKGDANVPYACKMRVLHTCKRCGHDRITYK